MLLNELLYIHKNTPTTKYIAILTLATSEDFNADQPNRPQMLLVPFQSTFSAPSELNHLRETRAGFL